MANYTQLTPFSRGIITLAIVGGLFFLFKTFVLNNKEGLTDDSTATPTGKASTAPVLLTLSGSSTLGTSMIPQIAKQFMSNDNETDVVGRIGGAEKRIVINTQSSGQGIGDVNTNKADLAMISGGAENVGANMILANIALDGIAVLVNKSNRVKELTRSQVESIFLGKITDWAQVGGQTGAIHPYSRSNKSGTYEAFKQLVLEQNASLPATMSLYEDSKQLVAAVEKDPNGIGFSSFSSIGGTNALGLSDVGTLVQYPSVFTIETEDYLLTRRLYLAHLATNSNPVIQQFIDFCEADDKGQKIVAESGFVNMNLHNADTHTIIANAPPQYLVATSGAKRLPTTLHFQSGSSAPDVRAIDDIKRIINILAEPQNRQKKVLLIGFTDNVGNPTQNLTLSTQRAQSIQNEFSKFGIKTDVFGFGQALPIAANINAVGQNKNRRVEVWYR
jgi:phosphate transport system substrate-binding protein